MGESASIAACLPRWNEGLTSSNWQRRLALGRAQGPAALSPQVIENGPSRLAHRLAGHYLGGATEDVPAGIEGVDIEVQRAVPDEIDGGLKPDLGRGGKG